jgi:hypothetical protein
MAAGTYDLEIEIGASFERTFTVVRDGEPVDFTGDTAAAAIRGSDRASAAVLCLATTENGRLALGADGTIRLTLDEEAVNAMAGSPTAVWDLFVRRDANTVWKVLKGNVTFDPRRTPDV